MKEPNEERIVSYLLGKMPEQEDEELEREYFARDDLYNEVLAVEAELIDAYLEDELSPEDRERFEKRFMAHPENRKRVDFARTLKVCAGEAARPRPRIVWSFAPGGSVQRLAWAAVLAAMILGASLFFIQSFRLRSEVEMARAERVELQHQTSQQRERIEDLTQELEQERSRAAAGSSGPVISTFLLTSGLIRNMDQPRKLVIPTGASVVRLELVTESAEYPTYRVSLQTVEAVEIWTQSFLRTTAGSSGRVITILLSPDVFQEKDYLFILQGVTQKGDLEDTGEYYFRVVKR